MEENGTEAATILAKIEALKSTKSQIENNISALQAQLPDLTLPKTVTVCSNGSCISISTSHDSHLNHGLTPDMIYCCRRHLLLPAFGVQGQSNLLNSSFSVVGVGGLGAPCSVISCSVWCWVAGHC